MAPHIIRPLRFVLPHEPRLRPAWMIAARARSSTTTWAGAAAPAGVRAPRSRPRPAGEPLQASFATGFDYSDCWVDDARLVVLNAVDAAARGADHPHAHAARVGASATTAAVARAVADTRGRRSRESPRARSSTPPGRGSRDVCSPRSGASGRATCGWSRAATSSCRGSSSTTTPTSSRTPTAASSSPSPTSATSR